VVANHIGIQIDASVFLFGRHSHPSHRHKAFQEANASHITARAKKSATNLSVFVTTLSAIRP